jgi:hypothetical protein
MLLLLLLLLLVCTFRDVQVRGHAYGMVQERP